MTTIGYGAADWWYVGSYTFTQDSNSSWSDSFSSGSSDSHSERTESADANGHGSYDFTAVSVLAANGSVTTTETLTGGGESHGHYHLIGFGYADSTSDTSDGDFSSHTELHSTFTQTDNENFDSSWQANLTVVITSSGTVVTGSVSGSDDADGAATFIAHGNGVSDSSTSGSEFSSGSHNDWTSDTTASDGYDYHGAWSDVYANGTLTSSSSVTNHIWGSLTTGSTSNWSTTSTMLDADGNPVTVTTSGGDSHSTSTSYDVTVSTGSFSAVEYSKSQPGSYAGAKPGGNTAMSEPWLSGDGRSTGDESFFGSGRPSASSDHSGDGIVLCSGPGQIVGAAGGLAVGQAQSAPGGHHFIPITVIDAELQAGRLSDGARNLALGWVSGQTSPNHNGRTMGGVTPREYSDAVARELANFRTRNNITGEMRPEQMERFITHLETFQRNNPNHAISQYNRAVMAERAAFERANPRAVREPTNTAGRMERGRRFVSRLGVMLMTALLWDVLGQYTNAMEIASRSNNFQQAIQALTDGNIPRAESMLGIPVGSGGFLGELTDNQLLGPATALEAVWIAALRRAQRLR
jgi:hypothetical protein